MDSIEQKNKFVEFYSISKGTSYSTVKQMIKNTQIKIEQVQLNEIGEINKLLYLSKGYWDYDRIFMDKFMKGFSITEDYLKANSVFSCYYNFVLAGFFAFSNTNDKLELDYFFISPQYIGKGIGKQLWNYCCHIAQEKYNRNYFTLWSDPNAENFYTKMGCKKIGSKKSNLLLNRDAPILEYWI
ncbi:MAG: hydroxyurea phosphotransferase [Burkholderiales bacterium]|nr:hydroxyurea phosphotransferase [Burkholderiales bacterium]